MPLKMYDTISTYRYRICIPWYSFNICLCFYIYINHDLKANLPMHLIYLQNVVTVCMIFYLCETITTCNSYIFVQQTFHAIHDQLIISICWVFVYTKYKHKYKSIFFSFSFVVQFVINKFLFILLPIRHNTHNNIDENVNRGG